MVSQKSTIWNNQIDRIEVTWIIISYNGTLAIFVSLEMGHFVFRLI